MAIFGASNDLGDINPCCNRNFPRILRIKSAQNPSRHFSSVSSSSPGPYYLLSLFQIQKTGQKGRNWARAGWHQDLIKLGHKMGDERTLAFSKRFPMFHNGRPTPCPFLTFGEIPVTEINTSTPIADRF